MVRQWFAFEHGVTKKKPNSKLYPIYHCQQISTEFPHFSPTIIDRKQNFPNFTVTNLTIFWNEEVAQIMHSEHYKRPVRIKRYFNK